MRYYWCFAYFNSKGLFKKLTQSVCSIVAMMYNTDEHLTTYSLINFRWSLIGLNINSSKIVFLNMECLRHRNLKVHQRAHESTARIWLEPHQALMTCSMHRHWRCKVPWLATPSPAQERLHPALERQVLPQLPAGLKPRKGCPAPPSTAEHKNHLLWL